MELKNYFAQNAAGDVLPDAVAYLYEPGTTTLVTGLQDAAGAALGNPVSANASGLIQFRAPTGEYDLRVTAPGREYTARIQCVDIDEQVAAADAAVELAVAAQAAAEVYAELSGVKIYPTYAAALAAMNAGTLLDGEIARIVSDETEDGRSTWRTVHLDGGATLELDFIAGEYASGGLVFITAETKLVAVPASSAATGELGSLAVDSAYLYVATGHNTWKRIALSAF